MKKISLFSAIALLMIAINSFGQSQAANIQTVKLSFGDKYSGGYESVITDNDKWTIYSMDHHQQLASGQGSSYSNFIFQEPGNYRITFESAADHQHEENQAAALTCEHKLMPDAVIVEVSPVKMKYDFSNISFSAPIQSGVPADNVSMNVPVQVEVFNNGSYSFQVLPVKTAGVATTLTAQPTETSPVVLQNGTMMLSYSLSGAVTKSSYVMFDFVDFNGNVQSYSLASKVD